MVSLLAAISALPAWSEDYSACAGLGEPLTEHSCFHTTNGPFAQVTAETGRAWPAPPVNLDAVHTRYSVTLPSPSAENVVSYTPARSGDWVVFVDPPDLTVLLLDPSNLPLSSLYQYTEPSCPALGSGQVYELTAGTRYRLVLGPGTAAEASVVIEMVSDFLTRVGRDRDQDGYGDPADVLQTSCLPPPGYADNDGDCDDTSPRVRPGALELCNAEDDDCDRLVDEDFGVGTACQAGVGACAAPGVLVCASEEVVCTATAAAQGSPEICNGVDDDCDQVADEGGAGLCPGLDAPACVTLGDVTRCGCREDSHCGAPRSARVCDRQTGRCVDGCIDAPGHNGCPAESFCSSDQDDVIGQCQPWCTFDAQCAVRFPERPACLPQGPGDGCVECRTDAQCANQPQGKVLCVGYQNTCAACTAEDRTRCDAYGDGLACLVDQRCGCISHSDCSLDQLCDDVTSTCVPCGDWLDRGPTSEPGPPDRPGPDGCSSMNNAGAVGGWAVGLALLLGWRRRSRLRPFRWFVGVLVVGVLVACDDPTAIAAAPCPCTPEQTCVDEVCRDPCQTTRDCPPGQACHPEYGFCVDFGGERCVCAPELSPELLDHACQHGDLGPFTDVVAATNPLAAPPPLEGVQRAHRLTLSPEDSGYASYRPTRPGRHAVLSGLGRELRLYDPAGLELSPLFRSSADCSAFDRVALYELELGRVYRVELMPSPRSRATVFFEHAASFPEPWKVRCDF